MLFCIKILIFSLLAYFSIITTGSVPMISLQKHLLEWSLYCDWCWTNGFEAVKEHDSVLFCSSWKWCTLYIVIYFGATLNLCIVKLLSYLFCCHYSWLTVMQELQSNCCMLVVKCCDTLVADASINAYILCCYMVKSEIYTKKLNPLILQ